MEFRLIYKSGREERFEADSNKNAVRKAFEILGIRGRIKTCKFYSAEAGAIYLKDEKIFPIP